MARVIEWKNVQLMKETLTPSVMVTGAELSCVQKSSVVLVKRKIGFVLGRATIYRLELFKLVQLEKTQLEIIDSRESMLGNDWLVQLAFDVREFTIPIPAEFRCIRMENTQRVISTRDVLFEKNQPPLPLVEKVVRLQKAESVRVRVWIILHLMKLPIALMSKASQ
jgi:hypothetical protein